MTQLIKKTDGLWIQIPREIVNEYSLCDKQEIKIKTKKDSVEISFLGNEEKNTLLKLANIPCISRTKNRLRNSLNEKEQKALGRLMKKKIVCFDKTKKVYGIKEKYLPEQKGIHGKEYLITSSNEANQLLRSMKERFDKGEVLCVKGFDKKIYMTTKKNVDEFGKKIKKSLETRGEMNIHELSEATQKDIGLIKTIVEIMRESGEVIEKKTNVYSLA